MARPREFDAEQALDQVMRTFWQHGYQATSIDELTQAAGVQKQSLYCAFGDKHSLFVKCVERYKNQTLAQVQAILQKTDSPFAGVEKVLRLAIDPARTRSYPKGCLAANTALELGFTDPEAIGEVKKMFRGLEKMLSETIRKGQEQGEITTRFESGWIAQSLINTLNGIRILEKTGASAAQLKAIVDMALAVIRV